MTTQQTMTAPEAFQAVRGSAETIKNDAFAQVASADIGDVIRQGDVYLTRIAALPGSAKPIEDRQLAPGTTQGSRHTAQGSCRVYAADRDDCIKAIRRARPDISDADAAGLIPGPLVEVTGNDCVIAHPEHGDRGLPDGTVWATTYQRAHAETLRAVRD